MFTWLSAHWTTILVFLVLVGIVTAILVSMFRDRKKRKSSCGCGCGNCPMSGSCHKTE